MSSVSRTSCRPVSGTQHERIGPAVSLASRLPKSPHASEASVRTDIMKWKRETCSERRAKRAMWHRWWAWHKVDIGGGQMRRWHWLERREIIWKGYMTLDYGCPPFYGDWYIWEYREPELARSFDELRDLVDELERAGKS